MDMPLAHLVKTLSPEQLFPKTTTLVGSVCPAKARKGNGGTMRFLLIHNAYQRRGGEDVLFETERSMILAHGHEVMEYTRHNDEITSYALPQMLTLPARTVWAWDSHEAVRRLCLEKQPDCAIIFNTLPLVSPAVVY